VGGGLSEGPTAGDSWEDRTVGEHVWAVTSATALEEESLEPKPERGESLGGPSCHLKSIVHLSELFLALRGARGGRHNHMAHNHMACKAL